MGTRIVSTLLALLLVPAFGMAQRGGGGHFGSGGHFGGGHGGGHFGGVVVNPGMGSVARPGTGMSTGGLGAGIPTGGLGRGVASSIAPPIGSINHPGFGFAPRTRIGFPLHPGNQIVIRSNRFFVGRHFGFGRFDRRRNVFFLGAPIGFPFFWGGYSYTMLDEFGYPISSMPVVPESPAVIVIEPSGQVRLQQNPPEPAALTLLVFKDHSIYAATDYWRQDDQFCYMTNYGAKNCIPVDRLDLEFTKKLNAERNVRFELPQP